MIDETSTSAISTFTLFHTTTVSPTFHTGTLTILTTTDVEGQEGATTKASPNKPSLLGIILGSIGGISLVTFIVVLYLKRHKLQARFSSRPNMYQDIIPVYSNANGNDGCIQLDNMRDRTSLA